MRHAVGTAEILAGLAELGYVEDRLGRLSEARRYLAVAWLRGYRPKNGGGVDACNILTVRAKRELCALAEQAQRSTFTGRPA